MDLFYRDPGTWWIEPRLFAWYEADQTFFSRIANCWIIASPVGLELRHATMLEF